MIGAVVARDLPAILTQSTPKRMLAALLRLSPAEASRRVRAAGALSGRTSMQGAALPPVRPHLAAAQRSGQVGTEQVAIIERAVARADRPGIDPAAIDAAERLLSEHATQFGPKDLKILADRVVDHLDPDVSRPD